MFPVHMVPTSNIGGLDKCFSCNGRPVSPDDELGLCRVCIEKLRDPDYVAPVGPSAPRTDVGVVANYRPPTPKDYETVPTQRRL